MTAEVIYGITVKKYAVLDKIVKHDSGWFYFKQ